MQISDETLMALADGELSQTESAALHKAIAADPALQSRLAVFRQTRDALGLLRGSPAPAVSEDPLAAMIRKAQSQTPSQTQTAAPLQIQGRAGAAAPRAAANLNHRPWLALAAGVAVAAVALGWFGLGQNKGLSAVEIAALQALQSGQSQDLDDGRALTMIASYKADTLCREYEITHEARTVITLACQDGADWAVRFTAETRLEEGGYLPASGDIEGLDAALAPLGAPLSPEDEAAALRE